MADEISGPQVRDAIFAPESTRRLELHGAIRRLRVAALADPEPGNWPHAPSGLNYRWQPDVPLYAVRFTGAPARVEADRERLRIRYPGWLWSLLGTRSTDLALHPYVRWHIAVRGGLGHADLDLTRLQLGGLDILGGLDRTELRLPLPTGELPVQIRGGASRLRLVCPRGAALRVRVDGGVQRLQVDTLRIGSVGGRFAWETPGFADNPRRIDLRLRGGVQDLAVDWPAADPLSLFDPFAPTHLAARPRLFGGPR